MITPSGRVAALGVMTCRVMSCHAMVWYGMVWYGMVWYVMLCSSVRKDAVSVEGRCIAIGLEKPVEGGGCGWLATLAKADQCYVTAEHRLGEQELANCEASTVGGWG